MVANLAEGSIVTGGAFSSDVVNARFADGIKVIDVWRQVDTLLDYWNRREQAGLSFMGYVTTRPDADMVVQAQSRWMRFSEHALAEAKTRLQFTAAVQVGLERFATALEWTDWYEVLSRSTPEVTAAIRSIFEANARFHYRILWQQALTNQSRVVVDELRKPLSFTVPPFYAGAVGDIPAPVGGVTFSDQHQHFDRTATTAEIVAADLRDGFDNIREHGFTNKLCVVGNHAAVVEMLSIGDPYVARVYVRNPLIPDDAINASQGAAYMAASLPLNDMFRIAGTFENGELILENNDIPAGYLFFFSHEGPRSMDNPLQVRLPERADLRGIKRIRKEFYPFVHEEYQEFAGVSVRQRGNGAAKQWIYTGANSDPYVPPTWTNYNLF